MMCLQNVKYLHGKKNMTIKGIFINQERHNKTKKTTQQTKAKHMEI